MSICLAKLLLFVRVWLRRDALDRRLAQGSGPADSAELARRAGQLLSERMRRRLASRLERTLADAQRPPQRVRTALPLDRDAIRIARPELLSLARDLAEVHEPVRVRGVARAYLLLTDGASPLYAWVPAHTQVEQTLEVSVRHARTSLALG